MIPREVVEEILYRSDIEQIIGSYVTLKKAGSGLIGLCPFHSEKTPSFSVNTRDKYFHCFGCGAGGDVITFIMKVENLDYPGALEFLADRAGITLTLDKQDKTGEPVITRRRILDMNLDAARFFREQLFDKSVGEEAMNYLTEIRRLPVSVIKHFGLGFSPKGFGALTDHMHRLGYNDEELKVGFLSAVSQKTGKPYDYFRNRVIFPIIDTKGDIVAFGGRVMDDSKPKYLNTSDTPVFKKSKNLFALNYAKNHCSDEMILSEGYMDVIALHSAGFENAVATLGTSITPEHARLMSRYTKKVIISYDSDDAGKIAADRAMKLLGEVGLDVRVLRVSDAKDPDEYIRKYGSSSFRKLLSKSKSGFEYKMNDIVAKYDIRQPDELIKASGELCRIISDIPSDVEREIYISVCSEKLDISRDSLKGDVSRLRSAKRKKYAQKIGQRAETSAMNIGDRINPDSVKNIRAAAAEEAILGMLLIYPEHRRLITSGSVELTPDDFVTSFGRRVFYAVMELEGSDGGFVFSLLGEKFTPDEMGRITAMESRRRALERNDAAALRSYIETLKKEKTVAEDADWMDELKRQRDDAKKKRKNNG